MPEVIYKLLSVICPAEYSRKCCAFGGVQIVDDCPFRTDQNQALCITSASDKTEAKKLKMKFDKGDRYFEKELFEYVDDPIIESAESGVASQIKVPKGIPAGGIRISVTGKNLAYIQKPQMYVYYEKKMFISVSGRGDGLVLSLHIKFITGVHRTKQHQHDVQQSSYRSGRDKIRRR
jgi:hypothetical protein